MKRIMEPPLLGPKVKFTQYPSRTPAILTAFPPPDLWGIEDLGTLNLKLDGVIGICSALSSAPNRVEVLALAWQFWEQLPPLSLFQAARKRLLDGLSPHIPVILEEDDRGEDLFKRHALAAAFMKRVMKEVRERKGDNAPPLPDWLTESDDISDAIVARIEHESNIRGGGTEGMSKWLEGELEQAEQDLLATFRRLMRKLPSLVPMSEVPHTERGGAFDDESPTSSSYPWMVVHTSVTDIQLGETLNICPGPVLTVYDVKRAIAAKRELDAIREAESGGGSNLG